MRGVSILPGTGRWLGPSMPPAASLRINHALGVAETEGAPGPARVEGPLHHALRARSPSPYRGGSR